MLDEQTGSVFAVTASTEETVDGDDGLVVTLQLQNNYRWNEATEEIERVEAINLAGGTWWIAHGRYFTLPLAHYGDFTEDESVIAAVGTKFGAASLGGELEVGDWFESGRATRPLLGEAEGQITAIGADFDHRGRDRRLLRVERAS